MRKTTRTASWITAGLLAAAALTLPTTGQAMAYTTPRPSPSPSVSPSAPTCPTTPTSPNAPPSAPGTPEVIGVYMNMARLRWAPATDDDGIACYQVRENRDGVAVTVATFSSTATLGDVYLPWPPYGVPSQIHELYIVAVDTKGATGPASGTVSVKIVNDVVTSPSASPRLTCRVEYYPFTWPGGMAVNIALTNTGSTPIYNWKLDFNFTAGQQVTYGWVAIWSQTGTKVTATAPPFVKDIAPGQTLNIGFNGTHSGTNPSPDDFRLNDTIGCTS
ncbi:cellulose binding domain-containing protein [Microbispora amethystogenes]|uniref:cellulose binding domain-containing protein n=1 Tax=Microbispora amethystogenes TaxID=1427754 RepID=UPI001954D83A|nr:cellulose binding domain-containing protein [Microbispora amethystogenes]